MYARDANQQGQAVHMTHSQLSQPGAGVLARQRWMSVLAKADVADLEAEWAETGLAPAYRFLRVPESGLVMTRGRVGGTGDAFNLGEMTVTRCSVRLEDGRVGHAYVSGCSGIKAEIAAVVDALMQGTEHDRLEAAIIAPLEKAMADRKAAHARKAAATKVEFFTVARSAEVK